MADWTRQQEAVKGAFSTGVAAVTLGLGWLLGHRLTIRWAVRQKEREVELSAANELYRLYGEFFAVWKLWNLHRKTSGNSGKAEKDVASDDTT